jgi:hypothetical protein
MMKLSVPSENTPHQAADEERKAVADLTWRQLFAAARES